MDGKIWNSCCRIVKWINSSIDNELNTKSETELKAIYSEILNNGLHGLCFSPYVENQKAGDILSADQIKRP